LTMINLENCQLPPCCPTVDITQPQHWRIGSEEHTSELQSHRPRRFSDLGDISTLAGN